MKISNNALQVLGVTIGLGVALCALPWRVAAATDYYVTPSGASPYTGINWNQAFSNLQSAAALATNAGDTIYLRWGVYSNASQIMISNAANVTIRGGCIGDGTNDYSGTNSTLTKTGGVMRIIYGCNSTAALDGVTISGGYFSAGTNNGAGLYLTNCWITLTNCVICDNTNTCTGPSYGGGLYASGGSLTVLDSAFLNNRISGSAVGYGGGLAVVNCPLVVRGRACVFSNNAAITGGSPCGGAIYSFNADLSLDCVTLIDNTMLSGVNGTSYGAGVYHVGAGMTATLTDCLFATNAASGSGGSGKGLGGAVFLSGATGVVVSCLFTNNYAGGLNYGRGGGIYASGLQALQMVSNVFQGNRVVGASGNGGGLWANACSNLVAEGCTLVGSYLPVGAAPELAYVGGGGNARILNSTLQKNTAGRGLYFTGVGASLTLTNCVITGNNWDGLTVASGTGALFNCLLAQNVGDGLGLAGGTVTVANCTLAENGGWGLNRIGGTGVVLNSIVWGNLVGGITNNESVFVDYSCLESAVFGGMNNLNSDPLFVNVPGCYYLSVIWLPGQVSSSPCIDAGSDTAEFWGLTNLTTRTDGTNDTDRVDLGYHYTNGVATNFILTATNCYVDALGGDDGHDGASWETAWHSITHALSNVAANATINVAPGIYSAANTSEKFPLTVQMVNLTLTASNTNASLTVLDNAGTSGQRVLQASGKGALLLQGLTFRGGRFDLGENYGAGLKFNGCAVVLTNCVVRDNTNASKAAAYGGGVYAESGALTILDSAFHNNRLQLSGFVGYGGGIAAVNCPLVVRGSACVFSNNAAITDGDPCGGAIYAANADLAMDHVTLIDNTMLSGVNGTSYGAGVYHVGAGMTATLTDCLFATNAASGSGGSGKGLGGAVFLSGATGVVVSCLFTNNYAGGLNYGRGGGIYASGLQALQMVSNVFQGNRVVGASGNGGGLWANACSNLVAEGCTLVGSYLPVGAAPELAYVGGGGNARILNSTLQKNTAGRGLYFTGVGASLTLTNCVITGNNWDGLTVASGTGALFNCLLAQNVGDGLGLAGGTVTVANCTLAENGGWGLNRIGGTGVVLNSIVWGNLVGGITNNESVFVDYSCLESAVFGGMNNLNSDPLFVNVPGCYYLSVIWLPGQVSSSPCIDAGSDTAEFWGLTNRTTRTDGTNDTDRVDLGYHYTNGVATNFILTATNCYVDALGGDDGHDGASWETAWHSITHALSNVAANATINVAPGIYSAANTSEKFPLTVQMVNLTLTASNTNASLTVLDNAGTSGQRVLQASGKGALLLQGLTFRGGRFDLGENYGAGLKFNGCAVVLTNCVVRDNTNASKAAAYGGGVYAESGALTILDSAFHNNRLQLSGFVGYGGGIAAVNCPLVVRGSACVFSNNAAITDGDPCGGAIYAANADLAMDHVTLIDNTMRSGVNGASYGAGIYHVGIGRTATLTDCLFATNSAVGGGSGRGYGGAVFLSGATGMVVSCLFTNNYAGGLNYGRGGGIYASGLQALQMVSNVFQGNRVVGASGNGGGLWANACSNLVAEGCTLVGSYLPVGAAPELAYVGGGGNARILNSTLQKNTAGRGLYFTGVGASLTLTNCVITGNNWDGLTVASGTGALFNCLLIRNGQDGLNLISGTATVANCTIATNSGWGITNTAGVLAVKNSIVWHNSLGGIATNAMTAITYSDVQDGTPPGAGNISAAPLFVSVDNGDFHVMSLAGSWRADGTWTNDLRMSPCIDAGDPVSPYALEPKPNSKRVNMGAYGNTVQASRSSRGTLIRIW